MKILNNLPKLKADSMTALLINERNESVTTLDDVLSALNRSLRRKIFDQPVQLADIEIQLFRGLL
jgi:hypothetical protein